MDGEYWDQATTEFRAAEAAGIWREHSDLVYRRIIERWCTPGGQRALKTDLFDEAAGDGLCADLARFADQVHGIDIAHAVVAGARTDRHSACGVQCDVTRLPYRNASFDLVTSNSTLDHFENRADITTALHELARVSAPGATLVISLDNLANPIIALRALLPYRLLRALRVVPYFVGATTTRRGLVGLLEAAGYRVEATTFLLHVPRVVAVPLSARVDRCSAPRRARLLEHLSKWELLARLPTAQWTGHYVAVLAVRQ